MHVEQRGHHFYDQPQRQPKAISCQNRYFEYTIKVSSLNCNHFQQCKKKLWFITVIKKEQLIKQLLSPVYITNNINI